MVDKECRVRLKTTLVVHLTYLSHCQRGHWNAVGGKKNEDRKLKEELERLQREKGIFLKHVYNMDIFTTGPQAVEHQTVADRINWL